MSNEGESDEGKAHSVLRAEEGMEAFAAERRGGLPFRTHAVEFKPPVTVTAAELGRVRKSLHISRAVFASYLRTMLSNLETGNKGAPSL